MGIAPTHKCLWAPWPTANDYTYIPRAPKKQTSYAAAVAAAVEVAGAAEVAGEAAGAAAAAAAAMAQAPTLPHCRSQAAMPR